MLYSVGNKLTGNTCDPDQMDYFNGCVVEPG